jgi:predicted Zn-dependent protease
MESNFLDKIIKRCTTRGYKFAEASIQKSKFYRSGFELNGITNDKVTSKFLFLRIINDDLISSANFAIRDTESIDTMIDIAVDNSRKIAKENIDYLMKCIVDDIHDVYSRWIDVSEIHLDKLYRWIKSESDLISKENGYQVENLEYIVETNEVFYKNSLGMHGGYTSTNSNLSGTINISKNNQKNKMVPFSRYNLKPFSPIKTIICTQDFENRLLDLKSEGLISLEGITQFSNDAISSLISTFASSLNIELILLGNSFIKLSDINKCILDQSISLFDNPLIKNEGKIYFPFDLEGTKAKNKCLIKKGEIIDLLSDREIASHIGCITAGNCYRIFPNIRFQIIHSNLILEVDKPKKYLRNIDNYVDEIGFQSFYEVLTGKVKGVAKGRKKYLNKISPVNFTLDFSLSDIFKNTLSAISYEWTNGNFVPKLITNIK